MSPTHAIGQPLFTTSGRAILFRCACGWTTPEARPEVAGTWRTLCAMAQHHLDHPDATPSADVHPRPHLRPWPA